MKLINLIIENFFCHEKSVIDFTQFNSALVVGKIDGNDAYSNGVGKTTIFKAIEYVLFNISDVNLEKIIRDESSSCKVILDFESNGNVYRVQRTRTKKGTSDLSLFQKNGVEGSEADIYAEKTDEKFWKDISGRRTPDTEKDVAKLVKINPKSFRSTVHFAQNDFSGLTTATPEKRKALLKEALSLSIYSKLEKIAKDQSSKMMKELDKQQTLENVLGNPEEDILELNSKKLNLLQKIKFETENLVKNNQDNEFLSNQLAEEKVILQDLENQNKFIILQKNKYLEEKNKLEQLINDYSRKKSIVLDEAKHLSAELKKMKDSIDALKEIDYSKIEIHQNNKTKIEEDIKFKQIECKTLQLKIKDLEIPLPEGSDCKYCRQSLSKEHIEACKQEVDKEIFEINKKIKLLNISIQQLNLNLNVESKEMQNLIQQQKELTMLNEKFELKEKEIKAKKEVYNEYSSFIKTYNETLQTVVLELSQAEDKMKNSSIDEMNKVIVKINNLTSKINEINNVIKVINNTITSYNSDLAVTNHLIDQKSKDVVEKNRLNQSIKSISEQHAIYPKVIDSFSSHGIPNLIIQNLLDDLQEEANKLLESLKPGLQLQFVVEKENKDDTLDILYFVQGKSREYEQLSGAMKLAVNFSLKLGLSFLLQKMFDTQINFLLLDEIDQALDKAGVEAFADIVKFFQKDFKIMVITHNDNLKNKFNHAILVEQNRNMISTAKVVSSW